MTNILLLFFFFIASQPVLNWIEYFLEKNVFSWRLQCAFTTPKYKPHTTLVIGTKIFAYCPLLYFFLVVKNRAKLTFSFHSQLDRGMPLHCGFHTSFTHICFTHFSFSHSLCFLVLRNSPNSKWINERTPHLSHVCWSVKWVNSKLKKSK